MDLKVLKSQWDRTAAIVLTIAGSICLIAGYLGVSDSSILAEQTRYIVSGGIGGIFLLGLGATLWISADLRDEWGKLDRIEKALGEGVLRWSEESTGSSTGSSSAGPAVTGRPGTSAPAPNGTAVDVTAGQAGLAHAAPSREHA